jgi:hypothetical protein
VTTVESVDSATDVELERVAPLTEWREWELAL